MSRRRQRRSLLGTPVPVARTSEDPEGSSTVSHGTADDRLPPDPALVDFDLAEDEFAELPFDAMDMIEDPPPAPSERARVQSRSTPIPSFHPPWAVEAPGPSAVSGAPRSAVSISGHPPGPSGEGQRLYVEMGASFLLTGLFTTILILFPWFLIGSPALQDVRRLNRERAVIEPRIIEVERQVVVERPVPVPAPVEPEIEAEAEVEVEPEPVVARPARVTPPRRRSVARKTPAPAPVAVAVPAPVVEPEPTPEPEPEIVVPPRPPEAVALSGRLSGKAAGDPIFMEVKLMAEGLALAHIQRGSNTPVSARGSYTLMAGRATLALVEPGADGASYTLNLDERGATGRVDLPDGKQKGVKVSR